MFSAGKLISTCDSTNDIVFIGNIKLRQYSEKPEWRHLPKAQMEMIIDFTVDPSYQGIAFSNLVIDLEILPRPTPAPAASPLPQFVWHTARNNYDWFVPSAAPAASVIDWVKPVNAANAVTRKLQIRLASVSVAAGRHDGKTFFIGVAGITPTERLHFKASVSAARIVAGLKSCEYSIDIGNGELSPKFIR